MNKRMKLLLIIVVALLCSVSQAEGKKRYDSYKGLVMPVTRDGSTLVAMVPDADSTIIKGNKVSSPVRAASTSGRK